MEYKNENKICQSCKKDFIIESEDFSFYEKMKVSAPTFCPDCRFQRRLLFRNNRVFYKCECVLCGVSTLTIYHEDEPFVVYCRDCWLSDKWDPMSYGRPYDFSQPFFNQFRSLQVSVPRVNLYRTNFTRSDYCNYGLDFKDCYLLFGGKDNERVLFGNQIFDFRDSLDIAFSEKIELGYELFECLQSNNLFFSRYSEACVESSYFIDCKNCINCFGCVGLRSAQYHIWNKPHSKEEYKEFLKNANLGSFKAHLEFSKKLKELEQKSIRRYARVFKSINSDGDDLHEARNTHMAFSSGQTEDSKFLFYIRRGAKDCYDTCFQGWGSELLYEIAHCFGGHNVAFGTRNINNQDVRYNEECHECRNIFGCVGLRKKEYCILNRQYSKKEYERLMSKIIDHMKKNEEYGEFFPSWLSPFAYNETIAQEYFPLNKIQAEKQGYKWREEKERNYKVDFEGEKIPDNIKDVSNDILNKTIACAHGGKCEEQCTEAFKIIPEEFKFYKRMNLPLPRLCSNCRHYQRINLRNPLKLWDRNCMCDKDSHFHGQEKCTVEFKTTYAPERSEIVYCEKCYQQEIY
ncbi:hypothetical protein A2814_03510 [Candidatus Nomurabacteria bacterium RIFCSPHIGHO2_01_FULL_38_19]|uniref:Zinc-binding domain-containing protein n=1 Tax=Candidatus Nomurabacteria bacterium RIFCSPHIGHO2_01_FULL_38_19 TaxID=1801732 RepID=A0A1F6UTZ4_9BACT|nr:MAG: hypothetical protein A2814_03510 [Candidatus Nomurabacteria bacterium RIFCSPHIGHO2_01_FULL_38_19]